MPGPHEKGPLRRLFTQFVKLSVQRRREVLGFLLSDFVLLNRWNAEKKLVVSVESIDQCEPEGPSIWARQQQDDSSRNHDSQSHGTHRWDQKAPRNFIFFLSFDFPD